jgi:anti-sigma factor RsiW
MKGHLDPDTAAEFRAGLITGHRERAINAHLATCAECASLTERLAQVSALLAAASVPTVPDSLARRLDRALADEIQKPIIRTASVRRHGKRRQPSLAEVFKIRVLAPAAAGAAVLAGAGYGLSLISASSTTSGPTSLSAGSGVGSGANHAAPEAAGASSSGAKRFANGSASGGEASSSGSVINVVPSGVNYHSATLKQQVSDQLAKRSTLRTRPASAGLAGCVRNVIGRSKLLLVESAHYNGEPATMIVLRQGGQTKAVVVGPTCDATVSDILTYVVLS